MELFLKKKLFFCAKSKKPFLVNMKFLVSFKSISS